MFLDDTACNLASMNLLTFRDEKTGKFDVESYEHAVRLWTVVLEISVLMAQFPSKQIAQLSYEFRTLGLGYANIGGLLMTSGIPYDSAAGRAICGALTAIMTGVSYATSAEMAEKLGPFPGYKKNREAMLRVMRNHRRAAHGERTGFEKLATPPVPLDHASCQSWGKWPDADRARHRRLGPRAGARREARLPQRASHRHRPHRHHRPGDGLRHHRHRARLRAGEVQEARRRRLLEDHQPRGARGLAHARLFGSADRRDRSLRRRSRLAGAGAGHQPHHLESERLHRRSHRQSRKGAAHRFRHQVRLQQMDAWRGVLPRHARHFGRRPRLPGLRPARRARLHQARDRRLQHPCLRRHDDGRRPASQSRALCGVRLRQPVRTHRQTLSLGRKPHPHDGGGAALHLRRHLQDHQHAQRGDGRGLQGGLSLVLEAGAESQRALPRWQQALAAAQLAAHCRRGRRGRCDRGLPRASRRGARDRPRRESRREDRRARHRAARAREAARPPQRLHAEGRGRRPQGLSAHRRI